MNFTPCLDFIINSTQSEDMACSVLMKIPYSSCSMYVDRSGIMLERLRSSSFGSNEALRMWIKFLDMAGGNNIESIDATVDSTFSNADIVASVAILTVNKKVLTNQQHKYHLHPSLQFLNAMSLMSLCNSSTTIVDSTIIIGSNNSIN